MKLCINADDYLIHERVSSGICEAIEAGAVTSISVMGDADFGRSLEWLGESRVSVGLHLTLTSGGNRRLPQMEGPVAIVKAGLSGKLPKNQVEDELAGQYARFIVAYGDHPNHLDCHEHIHAWPTVARVVNTLAERNGIGYVRSPRDYSPDFSLKKLLLAAAFPRKIASPVFFGLNLMGQAFTWPYIKKQFEYLHKKGVRHALWMVHAGHQSADSIAGRADYSSRETELTVLLKHIAEIRELAELVPMEALLQGRSSSIEDQT